MWRWRHEYAEQDFYARTATYKSSRMSETQKNGSTHARWQRTTKFDARGAALADRHYSRRTVGSPQFMPPGRTLVFVTTDGLAVWGTHWPLSHLALDGLDAWRCSIFRNEGPRLSSELVVEAMDLTAELWQERPRDGWLTFVKVDAVRSVNPGACFKAAGWELDRGWTHPKMVRLTAPVPAAAQMGLAV